MPDASAASPRHDHEAPGTGSHSADLADLLDLDAAVVGHLDDLTAWIGAHLPRIPSTVLDLGAGGGAGTLALARRFPHAALVALDQSASMIEHLSAAASRAGVGHRVHTVQADADEEWPDIGSFDLTWASSSLHHLRDPDHALRSIRATLNPDGALAVIEMDGLPRFLPDDLGIGRLGLEARCHDAMRAAGWNAYPDWAPYLLRAGFEVVEKRTFSYLREPAPSGADRYAWRVFATVRAHLGQALAADDLEIIDRLLDEESAEALQRRRDLRVVSARTVWLSRRR